MKKIVSLISFIFILILTGCSPSLIKPTVDEVTSVTLRGPCAGVTCQKSHTLSLNVAEEKKVIEKIVSWLQSAKTAGEATDEFRPIGGQPRSLEIQLKNGTLLSIQSSMKSIGKEVPNGYEEHSEDIEDQLTVFQTGEDPIRVVSPEFKAWINGEWEKDISDFENAVSTSPNKPYPLSDAINKGDIVYGDKIYNLERFQLFLSNVAMNTKDKVRITAYTDEGDPIFKDLQYNGEKIRYTYDISNDAFGGMNKGIKTDTCTRVQQIERIEGKIDYVVAGCSNDSADISYFLLRIDKNTK